MNILTDNRTVTRGAGSGNIEVRYQSGPGERLYLLGGGIVNLDAAARTLTAHVVFGNVTHFYLISAAAIAASASVSYPTQSSTNASWAPPGFPLPIPRGSGNFLRARADSVAATEDARFSAVFYNPDGASLTVTEVIS